VRQIRECGDSESGHRTVVAGAMIYEEEKGEEKQDEGDDDDKSCPTASPK